ncbi:hypothetical protein FJZ19_04925 [Candidatus Pacearchaeota archaeon]|nr:hypothetical protein [Candidatus Pacearchaeota archaeon]
MKQNLKTIILSTLFTLNMWVGDQIVDGAVELGRKVTAPVVVPAAQAYVNYVCPVAVVPELNKYDER